MREMDNVAQRGGKQYVLSSPWKDLEASSVRKAWAVRSPVTHAKNLGIRNRCLDPFLPLPAVLSSLSDLTSLSCVSSGLSACGRRLASTVGDRRGTGCPREHGQSLQQLRTARRWMRGRATSIPRGCSSRGDGARWGRGGGAGGAQPGWGTRRPLSEPGFQESLERSTRAVRRSKRVVLLWAAWHLFVAVLLGKQIVFMSERKDHVSGQSLQLVRSNPRPQPHMPRQGALDPLRASSPSLTTGWPRHRGSPTGVQEGQWHPPNGSSQVAPASLPSSLGALSHTCSSWALCWAVGGWEGLPGVSGGKSRRLCTQDLRPGLPVLVRRMLE